MKNYVEMAKSGKRRGKSGGIIAGVLFALATLFSFLPATTAFAADEVAYQDAAWNAETKTVDITPGSVTSYTVVTSGSTAWGAGWYAVTGNVKIASRVTVTGDVRLILCDGAKLTASTGITVTGDGNSLTIYGQSGGTGELEATGVSNSAGIGGGNNGAGGAITVNGGTVTATGGEYGAGIGGGKDGAGGTITVNGGTVTAAGGGYAAGIGGGVNGAGGTITVNGGSVTAPATLYGAGIGGGHYGIGGTITVNGGTVNATGGTNG
ncbi:MAG: hypothetical protein IJQ81_09025, partial [Oscillibacter sp.]|nr:hypothetical protein [Oscillibacter sp.]